MNECWDKDAETAGAALQDITYLISERDNLRRSGGSVSDVLGKLRGSFTKLERVMDKLEADLKAIEANPSSYKLTTKEALRKRDAFRKLSNEKTRLRGLEKSSLSTTDKDALLGSSSSSSSGSSANGKNYGGDRPPADPNQLMARAQAEIKNQDDILDNMSKGLDNLKTMGLAIRDETALHMKLLDNLEDGVDQGTANLKRETARAEHITRDTKTCWLYITICILLGVLIALVVVRYAVK